MGHRTIKKVALDFKWPLHQVWKGYINPYQAFAECKACNGSGHNEATKRLSDDWYTHLRIDGKEGWGKNLEQEDVQALIDEDRLWDFTRRPINEEQKTIVKEKLARGENSWLPFNNGIIPTAEEVNEWNRTTMGHDSINHWICTEARAKRLGIFGQCEYCEGEGQLLLSPELKTLNENWKEFDPPTGNGYQLWETCSEGSPTSPVFSTGDDLAEWCSDNATIFGNEKLSREKWLDFISSSEDEMDVNSMLIKQGNYVGSVINQPPKEK